LPDSLDNILRGTSQNWQNLQPIPISGDSTFVYMVPKDVGKCQQKVSHGKHKTPRLSESISLTTPLQMFSL
jgi:hypothetical protein